MSVRDMDVSGRPVTCILAGKQRCFEHVLAFRINEKLSTVVPLIILSCLYSAGYRVDAIKVATVVDKDFGGLHPGQKHSKKDDVSDAETQRKQAGVRPSS